MFTPRENNRLLDYYKIIFISRPILARANMGLDFVSGQYGCLFSRCRKYVINSLIHGHFHVGLVIILRPILARDGVSGQYGGLGMITRPIWKYPCINLYIINDQRVFVYCNCSYSTKLIQYCLTWVKICVNKHNNTSLVNVTEGDNSITLCVRT
jgi:hypothetical protein